MSRLEFALTLVPPVISILFTLFTGFAFKIYIDRQCKRIGDGAGFSLNQIQILRQVAQSSASVAAIFPAFLGFLVSAGATAYKYGLLFLIITVMLFFAVYVASFLIMTYDLRELHGRLRRPQWSTNQRPYEMTRLQLLDLIAVLLNAAMILVAAICYFVA